MSNFNPKEYDKVPSDGWRHGCDLAQTRHCQNAECVEYTGSGTEYFKFVKKGSKK